MKRTYPKNKYFTLLALSASLAVTGCATTEAPSEPTPAPAAAPAEEVVENAAAQIDAAGALTEILAAQPAEVQARYQYRHPAETLTFFGIQPGMTVVEALPGGGWYSKILLPYLGTDGALVGVNYATSMWPNFSFADEAFIQRVATWSTDWPAQAEGWRNADSAPVSAFVFGELPEMMHESADAVLFIRALHNLARFDGGFLDQAIQNAFDVLKPGGTLGVVQHEARADMPDRWASGSNGYLKKAFIIERMQAAGF
ncbi:MAG: methyltransferase, partial [Pseudomonadota bacterium]